MFIETAERKRRSQKIIGILILISSSSYWSISIALAGFTSFVKSARNYTIFIFIFYFTCLWKTAQFAGVDGRLPAMVELTQTEVYVPKTLQVWRGLLNWLSFFFQIFLQIVRGAPSVAQVFSYIGLGHRTFLSSSTPSFKPLPVVELQELHESGTETRAAASTLLHIRGETVTFFVNDDRPLDRLTVVLDLDETLVSAYETSSLSSIIRTQAIEAGLKWFELECVSTDKECNGKPKINYVTVFERPGLREFLRQLNEFADLVLFTAGLEGYARPLVDRIDDENRFIQRLYRPSTTSTEYREHVKDLSCLSKDPRRIVIVDNNPFSFILQPVNGIPCVGFSAGQTQDDQLLEVILPLVQHLSEQRDVRPVLYDRFHMPEWFQKHGIPPLAGPGW